MKTRALICASAIVLFACEGEESYQGRSVSELLNRLNSSDSKVHVESHQALTHIVPQSRRAIEVLARALTDSNPEIRDAAASTLANAGSRGRERLRQALGNQDASVRIGAAIALGSVTTGGVERETNIAALSNALDDRDAQVRSAAARAMMRLLSSAPSPAAERTLFHLDSLSRDKDAFKRERAIDLITRISPDRRSTWTIVRRGLSDRSHLVRETAALASARLVGSDSVGEPIAVVLLLEALHDAAPHVRIRAAVALGESGFGTGSALAALRLSSRNDTDPAVRAAAVSALQALTLACRRGPSNSRCAP